MRRKTAAATINVPPVARRSRPPSQRGDRIRERRAGLAERSGKMSSTDNAIDEAIRSQPRSVKDICELSSGRLIQDLDA